MTLFFSNPIRVCRVGLADSNAVPHKNCIFSYEIKRYFLQKVEGINTASVSWSFFFFSFFLSLSFFFFFEKTMILMLNSFIKRWRQLQLWISIYISSNSAFSCNVMTSLCFLVMLPSALVALCRGPMVFLRVYGLILNMMRDTWEPQEITVYRDTQCRRDEHTSSHDMIRVTGHFKQILGTLELV